MNKIIFLVISGLLAGCANRMPYIETPPEATRQSNPTLVHTFEVKTSQGIGVENALVVANDVIAASYGNVKPSCTTNLQGRCQFYTISNFDGKYVTPYSVVFGKVSKKDYTTAMFEDKQKADDSPEKVCKITLDPIDQSVLAKFSCTDAQGTPLSGVKISGTLTDYAIRFECISDSSGTCQKNVSYKAYKPKDIEIAVEAALPGRYTNKSRQTASFANPIASFNLTLDQPVDYLCNELKTSGPKALANQMATWVDSLRMKALIQDTVVSHGDFCTSTFKNKKYASVSLTSTFVYNSTKLTIYQIGVRLFDDVVRKTLDVVAPAVTSFPLDGYEINIKTASADISDNFAEQKKLYYQFYLPKKAVTSYKNKDLTGQQLIDASVVLLNDERIDVRLQ